MLAPPAANKKLSLDELKSAAQRFSLHCGFHGKDVFYSDDVLLLMATETRVFDLVFMVWKETHRAFFVDDEGRAREHCFYMACASETEPDDFSQIEGYSLSVRLSCILNNTIRPYFYYVDAY